MFGWNFLQYFLQRVSIVCYAERFTSFSKSVRPYVCLCVCGAHCIAQSVCVKSNLIVSKVTFNCKLQKKLGEQDVLVAPQ